MMSCPSHFAEGAERRSDTPGAGSSSGTSGTRAGSCRPGARARSGPGRAWRSLDVGIVVEQLRVESRGLAELAARVGKVRDALLDQVRHVLERDLLVEASAGLWVGGGCVAFTMAVSRRAAPARARGPQRGARQGAGDPRAVFERLAGGSVRSGRTTSQRSPVSSAATRAHCKGNHKPTSPTARARWRPRDRLAGRIEPSRTRPATPSAATKLRRCRPAERSTIAPAQRWRGKVERMSDQRAKRSRDGGMPYTAQGRTSSSGAAARLAKALSVSRMGRARSPMRAAGAWPRRSRPAGARTRGPWRRRRCAAARGARHGEQGRGALARLRPGARRIGEILSVTRRRPCTSASHREGHRAAPRRAGPGRRRRRRPLPCRCARCAARHPPAGTRSPGR